MLFQRRFWAGLTDGTITLAFRRWKHPRVRTGTRLRTPFGLLAVEDVQVVAAASITAADAHRAGFATRKALLADLRKYGTGRIHRVRLRHAGPDPRESLRQQADLAEQEIAEIRSRLDRLDRASRHGPWTTAVLVLIAANPGVRAPDLAATQARETPKFKADVRKLKELGLTESLQVGYRLSPRGQTILTTLTPTPPSP